MKRFISVFAAIAIACSSIFTASAEDAKVQNAHMSQSGTLEAAFTMDELIASGELLIYKDNKTGYTARVLIEENTDYAYTVAFRFEDGNAFFGFKTDIDYDNGNATLVSVHSKAATLPHRLLTDYEYSSQPYGEFTYIENDGFYTTSIGYVTELREFIQKGIKGQGVSFDMYDNGLIHIRSTVLDTDTKGGYDARSFKEIIGIHSKKIILALLAASFGLKHMLIDNVSKNSAELLEQKKNGEK